MTTKVFELANGDLLVIPDDMPFEIVSSEPVVQGSDPAGERGELHRLRARAVRLEDAIMRLQPRA